MEIKTLFFPYQCFFFLFFKCSVVLFFFCDGVGVEGQQGDVTRR